MVINFRAHEISQDTRKLTRTLTLNKKIKSRRLLISLTIIITVPLANVSFPLEKEEVWIEKLDMSKTNDLYYLKI
jgi:hypothetical protein